MLNEVLRQNPDLKKFKIEKDTIERDYLNFKIASFKVIDYEIKRSGIEFTKDKIIESFQSWGNDKDATRLMEDKDFLDFLIDKNIDISKEIK